MPRPRKPRPKGKPRGAKNRKYFDEPVGSLETTIILRATPKQAKSWAAAAKRDSYWCRAKWMRAALDEAVRTSRLPRSDGRPTPQPLSMDLIEQCDEST